MITKLTIISGGLREPSSTRLLADRLEASVRTELAGLGLKTESFWVDLRPLGRQIMDAMLTGLVAPALESAFETVASADAVIAVTPAFNASFSGLFKSFFDVLPAESLSDMPCSSARPEALNGIHSSSNIRCGRCSPICTQSCHPPGCTPPPKTSVKVPRWGSGSRRHQPISGA
jgi:NAD(P)H-dependent FMN reductase